MQSTVIPQGVEIKGGSLNKALLWVMRTIITITGLMVFFPALNPGRISLLINENVSLFTTAMSFDTITDTI